MLKDLVECKQNTNFILIKDEVNSKGEDLFIAFIKNHVENNSIKSVELLCYENPSEYYVEKFKNTKIIDHGCYSDPVRWFSSKSDKTISNLVNSCTSNENNLKNSVVFIDSLSFLLLINNFDELYQDLFNLKKYTKVICLIHGDVLQDDEIVHKLKYLSSAYVELSNDVRSSPDVGFKLIDVIFKKPGGKVIHHKELYSVNGDCNLTVKVYSPNEKKKVAMNVKADMKNLTTFKLGLDMSENEKSAKSNLVLPYLKTETSQSGNIIYEPDAGDEYEEDPDDDLDI